MVAEVGGEVRVWRDFPTHPKTVFPNDWGRGQNGGPPLLWMSGEVNAPPIPQVLQRFRDRRLQFLIAYNLLLKI